MLILSLDSASQGCSVCVWRDCGVVVHGHEAMERGQDRRLLPLIEQALKQAGVGYADLDRIAITRGPGSFTGLRIGLAAAQGLALASQKLAIGIDRFTLFRAQFPAGDCLVVLEAKRSELYCRFYPAEGPAHDPVMLTPDQIKDFLVEHPRATVVGDSSLLNSIPAQEAEVITLARLAATARPDSPDASLRPLYIRAPDVTFAKPRCSFQSLTAADAERVTQLHQLCFGGAAWNIDQVRGSLSLATTKGVAVMDGGQMLGFILYQELPEESEILTFCITPEQRSQGLGGALLRHTLAVLKSVTAKVFLEVAADNQGACRLYDKCGFVVFGKRPAYYVREHQRVDAVLYRMVFSA